MPHSPRMVELRLPASAGVEARVPAQSAPVRLASELTRRGAPTTDVMLAGNWKTSSVAQYFRTQPGAPEALRRAKTRSVHRLASGAVVSVGFVGERLDDAEVEGEGGDCSRANRLVEGGRWRPRPDRVGVVLIVHLVEGGDA